LEVLIVITRGDKSSLNTRRLPVRELLVSDL